MTQVVRRKGKHYVIRDNGDVLPVTVMVDAKGNDCVLEEAERIVAGPDDQGRFWKIKITGPLELMQ